MCASCANLFAQQVCVIDGADVMLMQNWEHVVSTLEKVNEQPRRDRGTDFSRVWPHLTHNQVHNILYVLSVYTQLMCLGTYTCKHIQR
jgi:Utp25, U3 small nucleolar RNA-associated SSU processome protein 25